MLQRHVLIHATISCIYYVINHLFIEVSLFQVSGLSCWLGNRLLVVQHLPDAIKALSVSVIVASVTEVISNVATTTLFLPVLAQLVSTL